MTEGFVYILNSTNSPYVKIGGTEFPPAIRLRAINSGSAYEDHGPWVASDFRHVTDWRAVERILHGLNEDRRVRSIVDTKELFDMPVSLARSQLEQIEAAYLVRKDEVDSLFQLRALALYLERIFRFAGLTSWLHTQGSWTLRLFPNTGRGRYFTINVGTHEVAFSALPRDGHRPFHLIVVDQLLLDFPETLGWIAEHSGHTEAAPYKTARNRALAVWFEAPLEEAELFFGMPGSRRALVAYWHDTLVDLQERDAKSVYARYHDYNAVAALVARLQSRPLYS